MKKKVKVKKIPGILDIEYFEWDDCPAMVRVTIKGNSYGERWAIVYYHDQICYFFSYINKDCEIHWVYLYSTDYNGCILGNDR